MFVVFVVAVCSWVTLEKVSHQQEHGFIPQKRVEKVDPLGAVEAQCQEKARRPLLLGVPGTLRGNKWNTVEQNREMLKTYVMIKNRKACNKLKS